MIGELDFAVGAIEDDGGVEVADESAKTLFAFAESIEGFALLGDVGKRHEDASEIADGIEFGDGVGQGPEDFSGGGETPGINLAAERLAVTDNERDRASRIRNRGTVFVKRLNTIILGAFSLDIVELEMKHIEGGAIGELQAALGVIQGDADMDVLDKGTEALFVGAKEVLGGPALCDIANNDEGAALAIEIEQSTGHVAKANLA